MSSGGGLTDATRRLGVVSGVAVFLLELAYVAVLAIGLARLPDPSLQIQNPWFTAMELLILALVVPMVTLMVALYLWVDPARKAAALTALVFMALTAGLTAVVHFSVLTLSRHPAFEGWDLAFAFTWPSVVYALDIVAWDVFFAISALAAAHAVRGWTGALLALGGVLALIGLIGVPTADMSLRNIGIIGYAVVFPIAALGLARVFARPRPR